MGKTKSDRATAFPPNNRLVRRIMATIHNIRRAPVVVGAEPARLERYHWAVVLIQQFAHGVRTMPSRGELEERGQQWLDCVAPRYVDADVVALPKLIDDAFEARLCHEYVEGEPLEGDEDEARETGDKLVPAPAPASRGTSTWGVDCARPTATTLPEPEVTHGGTCRALPSAITSGPRERSLRDERGARAVHDLEPGARDARRGGSDLQALSGADAEAAGALAAVDRKAAASGEREGIEL